MRSILTVLLFLTLMASSGCGGGGGGTGPTIPPPEDPVEVQLSRYRDPSTGLISPVLMESGSGFDGVEVDSPSVLFDPARPGGDPYLMMFEATASDGSSTLGVLSATSAKLETHVVTRRLAVGRGAAGSAWETGSTDPSLVLDPRPGEARYKLWFEGRSGSAGSVSTIVYAQSNDGVTWSGFTPCVLDAPFGTVRVADPSVLLDSGVYRMWFEAQGSAGNVVGYAESTDGLSWSVLDASGGQGVGAGPVLRPGPGAFDAAGVHAPCVVVDPARAPGQLGRYLMWYEAADVSSSTEATLGLAQSADGKTWFKGESPILTPSSDSLSPLPFDSGDLEHPTVLVDPSRPPQEEGYFLLWYTGDGEGNITPNRIGLAEGWAVPQGVSRARFGSP